MTWNIHVSLIYGSSDICHLSGVMWNVPVVHCHFWNQTDLLCSSSWPTLYFFGQIHHKCLHVRMFLIQPRKLGPCWTSLLGGRILLRCPLETSTKVLLSAICIVMYFTYVLADVYSKLTVGIGQDDVGTFSSQLKCYPFQVVFSCCILNDLANLYNIVTLLLVHQTTTANTTPR